MSTITQSSKQAIIVILLVFALCLDVSTAIAQQTNRSTAYVSLPDTAMQSYVKSLLSSDEFVSGNYAKFTDI